MTLKQWPASSLQSTDSNDGASKENINVYLVFPSHLIRHFPVWYKETRRGGTSVCVCFVDGDCLSIWGTQPLGKWNWTWGRSCILWLMPQRVFSVEGHQLFMGNLIYLNIMLLIAMFNSVKQKKPPLTPLYANKWTWMHKETWMISNNLGTF